MSQAHAFKYLEDGGTYTPQGAYIAVLPSDVVNRDELFQLLYENLKLPGYFGFNWDALSDCLRDFHWIKEHRIVLIHMGLPRLDDKLLSIYLEILAESCEDWERGESHHFEVIFPAQDKNKITRLLRNGYQA